MFGAVIARLRDWQRRRVLARHAIAEADWQRTLDALPMLDRLDADELARLRERVTLFLHHKHFIGAQGLAVSAEMALLIAAQACLPILNLDIDDYRGWRSIVVYPRAFVVELDEADEAGVVHQQWQERAGEAWEQGAVILSWEDICADLEHGGYSVVIHELAHKLDMQSGGPNGFPPLHADMPVREWTAAMQGAFDALNAALERGDDTAIDPYAAEEPGEFFAVVSEHFFLDPALLHGAFPQVYSQLARYYRQDPLRRPPSPSPPRGSAR
mgnify:CR=1 FL=1